nr:aldo/keto reductase [Candidatus Sigynarchaeota archaeon]
MEYTTLARTGLKVSKMGLGCGGPSRIGKNTGKSESESISIIRQALDAGINFIDTAESYRTEKIVGKAIQGHNRASVVLSTKKTMGVKLNARKIRKSLDASLNNLGTDYIDIYSFHAVSPEDYEFIASNMLPVFLEARDQGKIRFIGITEAFHSDTGHIMLQRALQDDCWDVMMVGFNILNQSARDRVLTKAMEKNIGILVMYAVRRALSNPARLRAAIHALIAEGKVNPAEIDMSEPLRFLMHDGGAITIVDAAYRFCCYEPGTHVILSGTGEPVHLQANIDSFSRQSLPRDDMNRLMQIFQKVDSLSGD